MNVIGVSQHKFIFHQIKVILQIKHLNVHGTIGKIQEFMELKIHLLKVFLVVKFSIYQLMELSNKDYVCIIMVINVNQDSNLDHKINKI